MNTTTLIARKEIDLDKILLFLQMNAHHVRFIVEPALVEKLLARLRAFAEQHPGKLVLEVVKPNGETMLLFGLGGAIAGASAGFLLAGLPGAALGAGLGACAGTLAAHLRLSFETDQLSGAAVFSLA